MGGAGRKSWVGGAGHESWVSGAGESLVGGAERVGWAELRELGGQS